MSHLLEHKLTRARRRHDLVAFATGLCAFVFVLLSLLALAALLDWYSPLSFANRAALLVMNLALAIYLLVSRGLLPVLRGPTREDLALAVERREPTFATRLIASIQLSRPGAVAADWSHAIVAALVNQTEAIARSIDFSKVVATDKLRKFSSLAGVILLAWMIFFLTSPAIAGTLLKRSLLIPDVAPVHRTSITATTGDLTVPRGQDVDLFADATGKLPDVGQLILTHAGGSTTELSLDRLSSDPHRYQRHLDNVTESFTYTIRINDAQTSPHGIDVRPRPAIKSITFRQFFPTYTHLSPTDRAASDLTLLAGSKLQIALESTSPLSAAAGNRLRLVGSDTTIALMRDPADPHRLTAPPFDIAANTTGLSIDLLDDHNIASADSPVYPIQIIPDRPPQIKITSPTSPQTLITPSATLPIGLEASDDIALGKILLHYQVKPAAPQTVEIDLKGNSKSLRGVYPWKPAGSVNTTIEFWLEALDTNDLTGPGRAESEHLELRVVTPEAKRADLMNRMTDNFRQLDEVTQSEQELNAQLGQILTEKSPAH